jgi:hypothetical protein
MLPSLTRLLYLLPHTWRPVRGCLRFCLFSPLPWGERGWG